MLILLVFSVISVLSSSCSGELLGRWRRYNFGFRCLYAWTSSVGWQLLSLRTWHHRRCVRERLARPTRRGK
eukprot:2657423-Amphidinium_carterae.1